MQKIEKLKKIATEAGEILKEGFYAKKDVSHKGVVDLVTQYDVAVEKFVKLRLKEDFPDYFIVAEESHEGSYHYDKAIYVDPIDGTTNFVHGVPHVAISIGLWEGGEPMMGVVYNPILKELYSAQKGKGAYLNDKKISVTTKMDLQQSLIATGFPYSKVNKGVEYKWVLKCLSNILADVRDIRRFGAASVDMCYVAKGMFDGYYEIDLKPWDVAAAMLVLTEAGGKVSNVLGKKYSFDDKIIVCSNGAIHEKLLEKLEDI